MAVISDKIVKILTEFGMDTVPALQRSLKEKLSQKASKYGTRNSKTNSNLSDSIKFTFPKASGSISFVISMNEYGEAVDGGRVPDKKAGTSTDRTDALIDWAKTRGVAESFRKKDLTERLSRQSKTKSKKKLKKMPFDNAAKSIAYLVSMKLKKKGFEGNHFFSEVIKDGRVEELSKKLKEVIKSDIRIEVLTGLK